jgi:photosystem II stability/assembly factor-like uncharacterized protein
MKKIVTLLSFTLLILFGCNSKQPLKKPKIQLKKFKIENCSIRAITVLNDTSLAFTGSNGVFGIINAKGEINTLKKIKFDSVKPEFRAIAATKNGIFVLSVGNPALLYKFKNDSLTLVYKEVNKKVFYDAMHFFDDNNGIAMGDPTDSCLSIITTSNGGNSWYKTPCSSLPKIKKGEAAFAASNTNLKIVKNNVWIVTGGLKSRVFYSSDKGKTWKVSNTPIIQGKTTTGIYSIDFYGENNGIIAGGDYTNKFGESVNKAITTDGGKTWTAIAANSFPYYVSCIQYIPNSKGKRIVAVSTNGIFYSGNSGKKWEKLSNEGFYAIKFVNKNTAWLSGNNILAKMEIN